MDSVAPIVKSSFPNLTSRWNTSSIIGTVRCRNDFFVACFDTLNRVVSINVVELYNYYLEKAGIRGRFFRYISIDPKPFTIPFAINCLAPGKYAVAQVDLPDTTPAPSTVRWYGGQEYPFYFIEPDDLTLLTIPQNVTWIIIESNKQVVELPSWTKTQQGKFFSQRNAQKRYTLRTLPGGRVYVQQLSPASIALIRVLGLDGKMLGEFAIKGNSTIFLDRKMMNKILLFEVNNGRRYMEKVLVYR